MDQISKTHKKHKKNKKEKKEKQKHSKHSSSDSGEEEWIEKSRKEKDVESSSNNVKEDSTKREDWMSLEMDFSLFSSKKENKKEPENKRPSPEKLGQTSRELNPYWRNGGDGLPPEWKRNESNRKYEESERTDHRNSDTSWSGNEKISYSSEDGEKERHSSHRDSQRKNASGSSTSHERNSRNGNSKSYSKTFKKPEDDNEDYGNLTNDTLNSKRNEDESDRRAGFNFSSSTRKGWKKIQDQLEKSPENKLNDEPSAGNDSSDNEMAEISSSYGMDIIEQDLQPIPTLNELNMLCAKMFKAEMIGDEKLAEELRVQVEKARRILYSESDDDDEEDENEDREVIILTETDSKGFSRPLQSVREERLNNKRKAETHEDNKRVRYFADDDSQTLSQMFERERFGSSSDQNATFIKLMAKVTSENNEDAFEETASMENVSRQEKKDWDHAVKRCSQREKAIDNCQWCLDSKNANQDIIVAIRNSVHLCVPSSQSLTEGHCIIVPSDHIPCATLMDEDVWEDLMSLRKNLVKMFEAEGEDVIFFECATNLEKHPHMQLHCVPVPKETGDVAPIYFKKAIMECEMEWSDNKKVIDLKGRDVRKAVPKGLPYFAVDFAMQPGYAHVIEDKRLFPNNFAQEIIGGMLDIDHQLWRKLHRDSQENVQNKIKYLKELIAKNL